jgi:hypothetical protein
LIFYPCFFIFLTNSLITDYADYWIIIIGIVIGIGIGSVFAKATNEQEGRVNRLRFRCSSSFAKSTADEFFKRTPMR